jgi:hypothetical protein
MGYYKMKFSGSLDIDGITKHFSLGEVIETKEAINEAYAEKADNPKESKKEVEVEGKKMETATKPNKKEKRS